MLYSIIIRQETRLQMHRRHNITQTGHKPQRSPELDPVRLVLACGIAWIFT